MNNPLVRGERFKAEVGNTIPSRPGYYTVEFVYSSEVLGREGAERIVDVFMGTAEDRHLWIGDQS